MKTKDIEAKEGLETKTLKNTKTTNEEMIKMKTRKNLSLSDFPGITMEKIYEGIAGENVAGTAGWQLWVMPEGTDEFKKVPNLVELTFPEESTEEIDVTDHDSQGSKEFMLGVTDYGELEFTVHANINKIEDLEMLLDLKADNAMATWAVTSTKRLNLFSKFNGTLNKFLPDSPSKDNDPTTFSGSVKVSGKLEIDFIKDAE